MDNRNFYGGDKPPENNNNGLMIAVVAGIVFFGIAAVVLSAVLILLAARIDGQGPRRQGSVAIEEVKPMEEEDYFNYYPNELPESIPVPGTEKEEKDTFKEREEETDEEYYDRLKDAIKSDLDYSVDWEEYIYEPEYDYVLISSSYPVLEGENIPNIEYLNEYIYKEAVYWSESLEAYAAEGGFAEDDEFYMISQGYVTYMDEEKISIVFSEEGYMQGEEAAYLYSINIDIQNGIVLENASILNMDDAFVAEFRERNRTQNSADGYIDSLSDQEIAEYLNSPVMGIVFYTPLGMEVGININSGWYTVTYKDYEKYLRKF